jgi:hypothetical protein
MQLAGSPQSLTLWSRGRRDLMEVLSRMRLWIGSLSVLLLVIASHCASKAGSPRLGTPDIVLVRQLTTQGGAMEHGGPGSRARLLPHASKASSVRVSISSWPTEKWHFRRSFIFTGISYPGTGRIHSSSLPIGASGGLERSRTVLRIRSRRHTIAYGKSCQEGPPNQRLEWPRKDAAQPHR